MTTSQFDGFLSTDSFRFHEQCSSLSSTSLSSSSSGYGSRLSLFARDSHRRHGLKRFVRETFSRCKSVVSLSSPIYEDVWNLDEQITKIRSTVLDDSQSIISMSVDSPTLKHHCTDDEQFLSAAAWYQEGLSQSICEEYLMNNEQPIGTFLIRAHYSNSSFPLILSVKTGRTTIQHYPIEKYSGYRIQGASKTFVNLSTLIIHHTVLSENLPVRLILSTIATAYSPSVLTPSSSSSSTGLIRSIRF